MVGKMICFIKCYKHEVLNLDTQYHTFKKKSGAAVYAYSDHQGEGAQEDPGSSSASQYCCISQLQAQGQILSPEKKNKSKSGRVIEKSS